MKPNAQKMLLSPEEVVEMLNVNDCTLKMWRKRKAGPKYIRLGNNIVRYAIADLQAWIQDRTVDPNS